MLRVTSISEHRFMDITMKKNSKGKSSFLLSTRMLDLAQIPKTYFQNNLEHTRRNFNHYAIVYESDRHILANYSA